MPPCDPFQNFLFVTQQGDTFSRESDDLLVEAPLEIVINQTHRVLIMFTPEKTRELVVGFVFTEGHINYLSEIEACHISPMPIGGGESVIEASVTLSTKVPTASDIKRVSYSSCGICGKQGFHELKRGLDRVKSRHRFSMKMLRKFQQHMQEFQPLYNKTGSAHAAILLDEKGSPALFGEDMGRHNALDKVIGSALINGIPFEDKVLVSSGRASLEMILKLARARIPVFVAMSRPTSRAVEAARFYNITLMDMAKGSNRIYSHARRIEL